MTWRPWTATDLRHLRSMIEEGCSSGTIAKALGRSREMQFFRDRNEIAQ